MGKLEDKIKKAVIKKLLSSYKNRNNTLILNEFEILNGLNRIDIAVFNHYFHGYEIKSDKDNLLRLPTQVESYNKIFEKMTLIVGYNHFHEALQIIPEWWGVKLYFVGPKGGVYIQEARREKRNPKISIYYLLQLLRKSEMLDIIQSSNITKIWHSKKRMIQNLIDKYSLDELRKIIIQVIKSRN